MVTSSLIRHLFRDNRSLEAYYSGHIVSFEDIKRRLLALEREGNRTIPDHYYRLNLKKSFEGIDNSVQLLRLGLTRIAGEYLEFRGVRIHVRQEKQNEWQQLLPEVPPLILQAALLQMEKPIDISDVAGIRQYYERNLLPNFKYTALPYPYIPQFEGFMVENGGFEDLHIHLNGTTEADVSWQNLVFQPDLVYQDFADGFNNPKVREQIEQETFINNPSALKEFLLIARNIRTWLWKTIVLKDRFFVGTTEECEQVPCRKNSGIILSGKESRTVREWWEELLRVDNEALGSVYHPFGTLFFQDGECQNPCRLLPVEALMYIIVLQSLTDSPRENVASAFHFYLLILGMINRLLVQQVDQYGFEQFQKYTSNELRSRIEKSYRNRFFQLSGNEMRNIRFLEGRFSPKDNLLQSKKLLETIQEGWKEFNDRFKQQFPEREDRALPQLKLIAHLIKKPESVWDEDIRHKKLCYDVWKRALVLAYMKQNMPEMVRDVVGIDAAASEFDAPPEVFAPAFRMLRRKGFRHFTYHAGEDFFHVVGGLRAIYEAVVFHAFGSGDRIGHATAAGIDALVWQKNVGGKILLRQGEWMDDLVFAFHLIRQQRITELEKYINLLVLRIQELGFRIYGRYYSMEVIEAAWLLRQYSPMLLMTATLPRLEAWNKFIEGDPETRAEKYSTFDYQEWCHIRKEIPDFSQGSSHIELWKKYHCHSFRTVYDKIIEIRIDEIFPIEDLKYLQLGILGFLHRKEIVIETLPTSNVRIGHHCNFDTYHLWNWMTWEEEGFKIPPIVIGTDDAGIFATNIYNEYANVYCHLVHHYKMSHNQTMQWIERFDRNARNYHFNAD